MISIHVEIRVLRTGLLITAIWPSKSSVPDPEFDVLSTRFRTEGKSTGLHFKGDRDREALLMFLPGLL